MDQNSQNLVWINNFKNRLAYLNFDAIFEFLKQFTISCILSFLKNVYKIWDRPQNMLILG